MCGCMYDNPIDIRIHGIAYTSYARHVENPDFDSATNIKTNKKRHRHCSGGRIAFDKSSLNLLTPEELE